DDEEVFLPYARDVKTLARRWAKPGTPGLEHRIGGLEKENVTGNISYEGDNHELMTRLRAEKVERVLAEIPPLDVFGDESGDVLVVGWGSTRGAIEAAVAQARSAGNKVGSVHLRFLNPLTSEIAEIAGRFKQLLVPELNNGQLVRILRDRFLLPFVPFNKIQGRPFRASEIVDAIEEMIE
ncbi:MAG: 2-oxoglutarate ferredoxin oxidoreductase subunit alpha, partial [Bacteroidetes bacterium]|nr:2-oxoglutarate ferredoxin oxidoreductase subunit alpha [Bacteroidota bacterium]